MYTHYISLSVSIHIYIYICIKGVRRAPVQHRRGRRAREVQPGAGNKEINKYKREQPKHN